MDTALVDVQLSVKKQIPMRWWWYVTEYHKVIQRGKERLLRENSKEEVAPKYFPTRAVIFIAAESAGKATSQEL